ncbi:Carbohydrate diacid regulator [compost metagenome]
MFEIDQLLAQEIVNRAMAILPYNVNVMDSQGLILGSGEPDRINTRHEGAQLVLVNSRVVNIDQGAAASLRGAQEGVNLPLCLEGQVIGVIGVSGVPDQIRTYAELVKMTAEMLVAQHVGQQQSGWIQVRNEDLIASILVGTQPQQRAIDEAQRVGLKPALPRVPVLVEITNASDLPNVKTFLLQRQSDSWCIQLHNTCLAWCTPAATDSLDSKLINQLQGGGLSVERIVLGADRLCATNLRQAIQQLTDLAAYGREILPAVKWLTLQAHCIPAALWRYRDDAGVRDLIRPYSRLQQKDRSGQLQKTLLTWFNHNGDGQACSEALSIHRNTLRYRMDRIVKHSGVNPGTTEGMITLYLGMLLASERRSR